LQQRDTLLDGTCLYHLGSTNIPVLLLHSSAKMEFFRAYGWETAAFHSFTSAGQRLKRMPPSTRPSEEMTMLEQSGIALLKRAA